MVTARYKLIFLSKVNNAGVFMEEGGTQLLSVSTLDSAQVISDTCKVILTKYLYQQQMSSWTLKYNTFNTVFEIL